MEGSCHVGCPHDFRSGQSTCRPWIPGESPLPWDRTCSGMLCWQENSRAQSLSPLMSQVGVAFGLHSLILALALLPLHEGSRPTELALVQK